MIQLNTFFLLINNIGLSILKVLSLKLYTTSPKIESIPPTFIPNSFSSVDKRTPLINGDLDRALLIMNTKICIKKLNPIPIYSTNPISSFIFYLNL